jgi:hypothetical protein
MIRRIDEFEGEVDYAETIVAPILAPFAKTGQDESSDEEGTVFGGVADGPPTRDESEDETEEEDILGDVEREISFFDDDEEAEEEETELIEGDPDHEEQVRANHYKDYRRLKREVETIFGMFRRDMPRGTLSQIAREHRAAPARTLSHWYRHWQDDRNWRPYCTGRNRSRRVFTDEQEQELMDELQVTFWSRRRRLTARTFKGFVLHHWNHGRKGKGPRAFSASGCFRVTFCRRHELSLRTPVIGQPTKRTHTEMIDEFLRRVETARRKYGPDRVLNMDETSWKDVQLNGRTIAAKRKCVRVFVKGNTKAAVTAVCTVSMSGDKYPPLYVLRGKEDRVRSGLDPAVGRERVTLSKNGWVDESVILRYLSWAHIAVGKVPFALVMDSFRAHYTTRIIHKAEFLGVELIPVPKGMTGEFQPLDRSCFGPLKKMSQRAWDSRAAAEPDLIWNHCQAARLLEEVWPLLKRSTIKRGWDFGFDPNHPSLPVIEEEEEDGEKTERSDEAFEPISSAMSESAPSEIDEDFTRKMNLAKARAAARTVDPVVTVRASLHCQPLLDPTWDPDALRELILREREERRTQRYLRVGERILQGKMEAMMHRSFMFPPPRYEKEKKLREGDFLFESSTMHPDDWPDWKSVEFGRLQRRGGS